MIELNHLHIPLSGMNLIEASAGTGKTYAIACLYLRLLIEGRLTPDQILVVTYTEAATKELRGRIRDRIGEALSVLEGNSAEDPFLAGLRERLAGSDDGGEDARRRLEQALACFDTAAIFTIHGFCLRALRDNAFESGSLYDTELVADQAPLVREVVQDFWRSRFFGASAPLLAYALRAGFSPDYFVQFLKQVGYGTRGVVVPQFDENGIAALERDCRSAYAAVGEIWRNSGDEIREIIGTHKGLGRAETTYRTDLLPDLFAAMDFFVEDREPYALFSDFKKFRRDWMESKRLRKTPPPEHPFFDRCQELAELVEQRFLALRWELIGFCRDQLWNRKQERNVRFFDDLLADLRLALNTEHGPRLAESLRTSYRAALIDEFQDTDPVQYEIFRTIYAANDLPLFLIGDPKQAIYSFRGADIFAYLRASGDVPPENLFTLTSNWRSTPRLLRAFNTVFDNAGQPFLFERIGYHPIVSGRGEPGENLVIEDLAEDGLRVWRLPEGDDGSPLNVGKANEAACAAVVTEIARLLRLAGQGRALIGQRPLAPRDMAVIVRSHRQAAMIQAALTERGVPSVMRSDTSVFNSHEANQLLTLLRALVEPGNESRVRAALVTDILGRNGDEIARLNRDETAWEQCLELFRDYHRSWRGRGFMVMIQSLMTREAVRGRLLRYPDGERRLTNLLHCIDLIHQADHGRGLGVEGALTWFSERIAAGEQGEEYLLRLETDEMAVKIVTIHVSKGLEYPLVFCPFLWGGVRGDDEVLDFHDERGMVMDFGSPDHERNRPLAMKEELAENLRLLYVALTRACYRCYLLAGKIGDKSGKNRPETSALAYLLHSSPETRRADDPVSALAGEVGALDGGRMERQLRDLAERSEGSVSVEPVPEPDTGAVSPVLAGVGDETVCREFGGTIATEWRVTSFTSFAAHGKELTELPDRDETPLRSMSGEVDGFAGEPDMFRFPRGARTGIFLHAIFEELDFHSPDPDRIADQVRRGLTKHGFDAAWFAPVRAMVDAVLATPLAATPGEGMFTLGGLEPGGWLTELEFFFPLRFITPELLGSCLSKWDVSGAPVDPGRVIAALDFRPVRGMVRGFMDMVFRHGGRYYLLDWKSNHLGNSIEDYGGESLSAAMTNNLYPLQYLLYTLALNRYLDARVPGYDYATHFGGVLYVFLRGVSPERGERFGFFRDLPPRELIMDLDERLIRAGGGAC